MGFDIPQGDGLLQLFVVHKDGQYQAFINSCPHTGVNLEWNEHQFLDLDNAFIQCATHDALFDIHSGKCVAGPCVGDNLTSVALSIHDGTIFAEI